MKEILEELTELILQQAATNTLPDWESFCQQHFKSSTLEENSSEASSTDEIGEGTNSSSEIDEEMKTSVLAHLKELETTYNKQAEAASKMREKYEALKLAYPYLEDAHLRHIKVNNKKREQRQLEERWQEYKTLQLDYLKDYEHYCKLTKDETLAQSGLRKKLIVYKNQPVYEDIIDASLKIKDIYSEMDYEAYAEEIKAYGDLVEQLERLIGDTSVEDELGRMAKLEEQLENHIEHLLWEGEQLEALKEEATSEVVIEEISAEHHILLKELEQIKQQLQQIYDRRKQLLKEDKKAQILAVKNEAYALKDLLECYKEEYMEILKTYYEKEDITKQDIINLFKTVEYLKNVYGEYFGHLDYIPQHLIIESKREAAEKYINLEKQCAEIETALEKAQISLDERLEVYNTVRYHSTIKAYTEIEPSIKNSLKNGITVDELKQMRQDLKDMQRTLKEENINYDLVIKLIKQWQDQIINDKVGIELLTQYIKNVAIIK